MKDLRLPELGTPEREAVERAAEAHWDSLPSETKDKWLAIFRFLRFHDDESFCYEIAAAIADGVLVPEVE